ncbi:hypothetical protein QJS10_CPB11g00345 [Acorus calamus]|uniref:Uncharacterized protein n=1 Tax=Acorus calamus TaxID=4465 RepID=A0AAV9DTH2_ACOCL|nr:hypothetical protein QJS10_CPB11g00345 [Acorus calamus]
MVADKGKKSKVVERDVEENNNHMDGDLVLSIEKLQKIQDEFEKTRFECYIRQDLFRKRRMKLVSIESFMA